MDSLAGMLTALVFIGSQQVILIASQPNQDEYLIRPEGYMAQEIPVMPKGNSTFQLRVDLEPWSITELSLERQHMEVDLIVTIEWNDNRLKVNPNASSNRVWVGIGKEIDKLWSPSLIFRNCKGCSPWTFRTNSRIPVFVHKPTGKLWIRFRTLIRFSCDINLRFYPMDVQYCPLQIYTGEDYADAIVLKHFLREGERKITGNLTLSEFAPAFIQTGDCTFDTLQGSSYSCIELVVRYSRLLGFHMTTTYLPTSFIVVLSWISFWLPADIVPARVALGLTSLLTLATRLDQAQKNLPAVAYAKAIDVWMLACILLVSMSLLEFAICNYLNRRRCCGCFSKIKRKIFRRKCTPHASLKVRQFQHHRTFSQEHLHKEAEKNTENARLDVVSRFLFPALFVTFNLFYWNYYLYSSQT